MFKLTISVELCGSAFNLVQSKIRKRKYVHSLRSLLQKTIDFLDSLYKWCIRSIFITIYINYSMRLKNQLFL